MSDATPFLGTTTKRKEAFPSLKTLRLVVSTKTYGETAPYTYTFNENNFPAIVRCRNQLCEQGGLELSNIINFYENGEYEFDCQGHEGTPKGRRIGYPCWAVFKVSLYKETL